MVCFTTADQSSKVLKSMFDTKKHMDVTFLAGPNKKIIKAHKSVLTAALKNFELMFWDSFKENDDSTIVLDEIEPEIIESIVKFVYCGVIEIPDMDTAFQLWEPVHTVGIKSLQGHILEYMKSNITTNNCLQVYLFAKNYNEDYLSLISMEFAVSNISIVCDRDEFLYLEKDIFTELIRGAKDRDVIEDKIVKAALTWLNFNKKRHEHFREIIYLLDVENIIDLSLINQLESMCTELDLMKYISNVLKKRCFNNRSLVHSMNSSAVDGIIFIQNNDRNSTISAFDVTSNQILSEENAYLKGNVLGTWNGTLIILHDNLFKITSYNIKTKALTHVGFYQIMNYLDATILDNELYIVTLNHCYIIDLASGRLLKTLNCSPKYEFKGVTSCKKAIYFMVLKQNQNRHYQLNEQRLAQYFSDTNLIKIVSTPLILPHRYNKCIGHNDFIFLFTENTVSIFELIRDLWMHQTFNLSSISNAVSTKNKLIVLQDNAYVKSTLIIKSLNYKILLVLLKTPVKCLLCKHLSKEIFERDNQVTTTI